MLEQNVETAKLEDASHQAHSLKGVAGNLGLENIGEIARQLEVHLKVPADEFDSKPALYHARLLRFELSKLHHVLASVEDDVPGVLQAAVSDEEAKALLAQIVDLLQRDDAMACDRFLQEKSRLLSFYGEPIDRAEPFVLSFDYRGALQVLGELTDSAASSKGDQAE